MFLVKMKPYDRKVVVKAFDKHGNPIECVIVVAGFTNKSATIGVDCPKEILIDVVSEGPSNRG